MKNSPFLQVGIATFVAFCVGYFIADDSAKLSALSAQIADLKVAAIKHAPRRSIVIPAPPPPHRADEREKTAIEPSPIDPWQEFLSNRSENANQRREEDLRAEYSDLFSSLGVTPEKSAELIAQLLSMTQASRGANGALMDLAKARAKYLDMVESSMNPDAITAYEKYEKAKPARRELAQLNNFLSANQFTTIDADSEPVLVDLLRESQAFTTRTSTGPYDGAPRPAVGQRFIIEHLEGNAADFRQARDRILQTLTQQEWPEEWLQIMGSYYDSRIQETLNQIEYMQQPAEVRSAERLRRAQARIGVQPDATANRE